MNEDGSYQRKKPDNSKAFCIHKEFYKVTGGERDRIILIEFISEITNNSVNVLIGYSF